jgi:hypothetical protein
VGAFEHFPRFEWSCQVLRGEGLLRSSDVIAAADPEGMLACAAANAFVEQNRKADDGAAYLRVSSVNGSLDFVVHVTWWPPVCKYRCAFADWDQDET